MHYPISQYYIRRIRIGKDSALLPILKAAGYLFLLVPVYASHFDKERYKIEKAVENAKNVVVEIPINAGEGLRKAKDISMWEQLSLAAFLQKYWADNQVKYLVTYNLTTNES